MFWSSDVGRDSPDTTDADSRVRPHVDNGFAECEVVEVVGVEILCGGCPLCLVGIDCWEGGGEAQEGEERESETHRVV